MQIKPKALLLLPLNGLLAALPAVAAAAAQLEDAACRAPAQTARPAVTVTLAQGQPAQVLPADPNSAALPRATPK